MTNSQKYTDGWSDAAHAMFRDADPLPEPPEPVETVPEPYIAPGPVAQKAMRSQLPIPVKAWKSKSENDVCILLDDDSTLKMPVRARGTHWVSLSVSQRIWTHWRANKAQMQRLGFTARKEQDIWHLTFHQLDDAANF